ncbi:MAG: hypothetical protein DCC50_00920, partial [Acidobacteria bacterium]
MERLRQAGLARSVADAQLVAAVRGIVDAVRARELDRRGLDRDHRWSRSCDLTATVRSAAVGEVEVALGLTGHQARTLITAATARGSLYATVAAALGRGEVTWDLVARFYDKTGPLEADQQDLVATALLGTDPHLAAPDRLDPDGDLHGRAWPVAGYKAALEAEVAACAGTDPGTERAARRRAYEARRVRVRVHDDGTAIMSVRGPA